MLFTGQLKPSRAGISRGHWAPTHGGVMGPRCSSEHLALCPPRAQGALVLEPVTGPSCPLPPGGLRALTSPRAGALRSPCPGPVQISVFHNVTVASLVPGLFP